MATRWRNRRKELGVLLSMPCLKGRTRVPELLGVFVNSDRFWSYLLRSSNWEMWLHMTCPNPCEEVQDWSTAHWSMTESFLLLVFISLILCDSLLPPAHSIPSNSSFSSVLALSKPTFPENRVCSPDFHHSLSVELSFWNLRLLEPAHSLEKE